MRSELVFSAIDQYPSRYSLCRAIFVLVRKVSRRSGTFPQTINSSLEMAAQSVAGAMHPPSSITLARLRLEAI